MSNSNNEMTFLLGAPDPEMGEIERTLRVRGYKVLYATAENGDRVHPGIAYKAVSFGTGTQDMGVVDVSTTLVAVECGGPVVENLRDLGIEVIVVDHHNPGDPGFDAGPEKYWEGSSLGQVFNLIGLPANARVRLIAAADHCPGHAYQGLCPKVNVSALRAMRVKRRAKFRGVSLSRVTSDVQTARALIQVKLGKGEAVPHFSKFVAELPEASLCEGTAVSYEMVDSRSGRSKVGLLNAGPELCQEWMSVIAPSKGLVDIYGSPARGYAGGYLS